MLVISAFTEIGVLIHMSIGYLPSRVEDNLQSFIILIIPF